MREKVFLINLELIHVNARQGVMKVLGKGQKERLVPMGEKLINIMDAYLNDSRPKLLNRNKSIIINEIFFQQPDEIVFRSLSQLIHFVGNKNNFARGKKVSNLINNINFSKNLKKQTLSGCIIEKVNKSLIISREN